MFDKARNDGLRLVREENSHDPDCILFGQIKPDYFFGGRR
jgi:hypothetical protein